MSNGIAHPAASIRSLRIDGLKALTGASSARLAPITLVYGPNSAGKSTLLQGLLVAAQSLLNGRPDLDPLQARGPLVDLGSFEGMLSFHDVRRPLRLGVDVSVEGRRQRHLRTAIDLTYRWSRMTQTVELRDVTLAVEDLGSFTVVRRDPTLKQELDEARRRPSYFAFSDQRSTEAFVHIARGLSEAPEWRAGIQSELLSERSSGRRPAMFEPAGLLPGRLLPGSVGAVEGVEAQELAVLARAWSRYIGAFARDFNNLLQRVAYLGPIRQPPQRLHVLSGLRRSNVGSAGEHAVDALARDDDLVQRVNRALARLEVPYVLSLERLGRDESATIGDVVALVLTDTRNNVRVSPADVGFGLSQLLPIIVESFLTGSAVVAIEQPEIHLHPRLQADLAEVLIEAAVLNGTQFVVETHSENLLLRVQRRIREGRIPASLVCVLYVDQPTVGAGARVTELRLDEAGAFIDEWPSGFFEERFEELFPDL